MHNNQRYKGLVIVIATVAATGGLLFGFDTGVISGAIPYFQKDFNIDDSWVELITTAGLAGAVLGAVLCGRLADVVGRKKVILLSSVIFILGALLSGFAPNANMLLGARFFLGIAIGISSFAVPLYIAEISPARIRGKLVSMFQLMITIGIMLAYFTDLAFALPEGDPGYNDSWRPMFYAGVIPALVMFLGMIFLPETPRWLISKGREKQGIDILNKVEDPELVPGVIVKMKEEIELDRQNKTGWKEVFKPWVRAPLIIAVGIMFIQQFTGINTIIYYSPKIFLMSGFDGARSAIMASVSVGITTVLFTILSLFLIDKLGRRKLYFIGLSGMVVSLIALGTSFLIRSGSGIAAKEITIVLILVYCAFFCISLGPLGWLIISEIFPLKIRGTGSSIGSLSCWFFNGLTAFTFFKIVKLFTFPGTDIMLNNENLGNPAGAFWFYALVGLAGLIWGFYFIPETKGKSLEQIEEHWRKGKSPREL